MKTALTLIALNAVAIAATIAAAVLCFHDKSGWGWFVFIALVSAVSPKSIKD